MLEIAAARDPRSLVDSPVIWLDLKGPSAKSPCVDPLEAGILITHGLSHEYHAAATSMAYTKADFQKIKKRAHVSCLENGLLDDSEKVSKAAIASKAEIKEPWKQAVAFWKSKMEPIAEHMKVGPVWLPFWNADYEEFAVKHLLESLGHGSFDFRVVELRAVSGMLVDLLGLDYPERSNWRTVDNLRWCFGRLREFVGAQQAKSRFVGQ